MLFVYKKAAKRVPAKPRPRAGCRNDPAPGEALAEPAVAAAEDEPEPASVVAVGVGLTMVVLPPVTVENPVLAVTIGGLGATGAAELAIGAAELAIGAAELATGATELTPAGVDATAG